MPHKLESATRGILLYDFLQVAGGAEKLTLSLLEHVPEVDLLVSARDRRVFPDESLSGYRMFDLDAGSSITGWRTVKSMRAFSSSRCAFIRDYDWALFSGSNAPLAVRHRGGQSNYYYCHTIPRFAYDLQGYYLDQLPAPARPALRALAMYVRRAYEPAVTRMNKVIANSENVRRRLKQYIGVDSTVVHPPIETSKYNWLDAGDFFLSTARLERFKRVDRIVEAFRRLPNERLIIASGGRDEARLRALAGDAKNIQFTSWLEEGELADYIGRCRAVVYIPIDEDFGMSPVEAMAAGKPVIGCAEGGLLETIDDGVTGRLLPADPTVEHLIAAVAEMDAGSALSMRRACEARAMQFSREAFVTAMRELLPIDSH